VVSAINQTFTVKDGLIKQADAFVGCIWLLYTALPMVFWPLGTIALYEEHRIAIGRRKKVVKEKKGEEVGGKGLGDEFC